MAPRILDRVAQVHRPPRQAKPGSAPGRGAQPGAVGQPPFVPTDEQRLEVKKLVACGFTNDSISIIMTIPIATLERHFPFELQHGKLMTDARILGNIVQGAIEGDRTFAIFWAKARAGWRDVGKDAEGAAPAFTIAITHNAAPAEPPRGITVIHSLPEPEEQP